MKNAPFIGLAMSFAILLTACASLPRGWKEYREATKCHLQNKNEECDESYEQAIKKNPKIPGLQASYASHLFRRGDAAGAEEHFKAEMEAHPRSQQAILVVFKGAAPAKDEVPVSVPDSASATTKLHKGER